MHKIKKKQKTNTVWLITLCCRNSSSLFVYVTSPPQLFPRDCQIMCQFRLQEVDLWPNKLSAALCGPIWAHLSVGAGSCIWHHFLCVCFGLRGARNEAKFTLWRYVKPSEAQDAAGNNLTAPGCSRDKRQSAEQCHRYVSNRFPNLDSRSAACCRLVIKVQLCLLRLEGGRKTRWQSFWAEC